MRLISFVIIFSLCGWTAAWSAETVSSTCSAARQVVKENGQDYYVVGARASTLYMISRDLYGKPVNWKRLATWNALQEPFALTTGQHLLFKIPPTLTEAEANKVLIKAWVDMGEMAKVQQIAACANSKALRVPADETVAAESMVAVPAPEVAPAPAVNPPAVVTAAVPEAIAEAPAAAPTPPPPAAAPVDVAAMRAYLNPPPPKVPRWGFRPALTGSVFQVESKDSVNALDNKIYSKFNYGAELKVSYRLSDDSSLYFGGGIEHVALESGSGGSILLDEENFLNFSVRSDYRLIEPLMLFASADYAQRPFVRAVSTGAAVDAVYIPEFRLGGRYHLASSKKSETWLVADVVYSLATSDTNYDIKQGHGYEAGVNFSSRSMRISALYRALQEKTELAKITQQAGLVTLGFAL